MNTSNNVNEIALHYLANEASNELNLVMTDQSLYLETLRFLGSIAATNRLGFLYISHESIDMLFDGLDPQLDDRFTIWISSIMTSLQIHLEAVRVGMYKELQDILIAAVSNTVESEAFPPSLAERIDVNMLKDPLYVTLFMLQPAVKHLIANSTAAIASNTSSYEGGQNPQMDDYDDQA